MKRNLTPFTIFAIICAVQMIYGTEEARSWLILSGGIMQSELRGTVFSLSFNKPLINHPLFLCASVSLARWGEQEMPVTEDGIIMGTQNPSPLKKTDYFSLGIRYGQYLYVLPHVNYLIFSDQRQWGWDITAGVQLPVSDNFTLGCHAGNLYSSRQSKTGNSRLVLKHFLVDLGIILR